MDYFCISLADMSMTDPPLKYDIISMAYIHWQPITIQDFSSLYQSFQVDIHLRFHDKRQGFSNLAFVIVAYIHINNAFWSDSLYVLPCLFVFLFVFVCFVFLNFTLAIVQVVILVRYVYLIAVSRTIYPGGFWGDDQELLFCLVKLPYSVSFDISWSISLCTSKIHFPELLLIFV